MNQPINNHLSVLPDVLHRRHVPRALDRELARVDPPQPQRAGQHHEGHRPKVQRQERRRGALLLCDAEQRGGCEDEERGQGGVRGRGAAADVVPAGLTAVAMVVFFFPVAVLLLSSFQRCFTMEARTSWVCVCVCVYVYLLGVL